MKKVILDTNFLLLPGQFKLDVFTAVDELMREPYELYVLQGTLEELNELAQGGSKDAAAARLGFVLAKQKGLKTLPSSHEKVDDALEALAGKDVTVATQDKELKKRVKRQGGAVITMRQKQRLVLED